MGDFLAPLISLLFLQGCFQLVLRCPAPDFFNSRDKSTGQFGQQRQFFLIERLVRFSVDVQHADHFILIVKGNAAEACNPILSALLSMVCNGVIKKILHHVGFAGFHRNAGRALAPTGVYPRLF